MRDDTRLTLLPGSRTVLFPLYTSCGILKIPTSPEYLYHGQQKVQEVFIQNPFFGNGRISL
jgi:hypothetical protein